MASLHCGQSSLVDDFKREDVPSCSDRWLRSSPEANSQSSVPGRVDRSMYAAAQHLGISVEETGIVDSMCACAD